jgi:subtilisin family serine protease
MATLFMHAKLPIPLSRILLLWIGAVLFWTGPARASSPDIDPAVVRLLADTRESPATPGYLRSLGAPLGGEVEVFVRASAGSLPVVPGLETFPLHDGTCIARGEPSALQNLIDTGAVRLMRLSRPVRMALDLSTAYLGMGSVRHPDLDHGTFFGQTGRGVAVGIVDTGIDWLHPDFREPTGGTRIDRYWDQTSLGIRPPAGYPYGVEFTSRDLDNGVPIIGIDLVGHGTHVLGIAAGNGRGSFQAHIGIPLAGMAPEATLLVVRTNFTEGGVVLGCQYIFERAAALEMPAVINLSLGNHFGPHRGTTPFESALTDLVGPGHLIVAAAGNDGDRAVHAKVRFDDAASKSVKCAFPGYPKGTFPFVALEGWFPRADRYRFTVRNPLGTTVGTLESGDLKAQFLDTKGVVGGWNTEDLGMGTVYVEVVDNASSDRLASGIWTVDIEPLKTSPGSAIDFWLANWGGFPAGQEPSLTSYVDPEATVISPSTSPKILSVGAVATRDCWEDSQAEEVCYATPPPLEQVAYFSSRGPTPDGRDKPEVLAPGFGVVSARSSGILPDYGTPAELARWSTPNGLYYVSQGTSMAAPHVTGTVALLLARYPQLTFEQMRHRLTARSRHLEDWRDQKPVLALQSGEALAPLVDVSLSELIPEPSGFRLRWFVSREEEPVTYRIYRAFDTAAGPFTLMASRHIEGTNPFEILDGRVEPGRTHVYRVAAVEADGLEDPVVTESGLWKGTVLPAFRPPDPNPARGPMTFRYFVPVGTPVRVVLSVYDAAGRRIVDLEPRQISADGEGMASWDLRDAEGRRVGGGVYFARLDMTGTGERRHFEHRFVVLP